jgi:hypothetical protein
MPEVPAYRTVTNCPFTDCPERLRAVIARSNSPAERGMTISMRLVATGVPAGQNRRNRGTCRGRPASLPCLEAPSRAGTVAKRKNVPFSLSHFTHVLKFSISSTDSGILGRGYSIYGAAVLRSMRIMTSTQLTPSQRGSVPIAK